MINVSQSRPKVSSTLFCASSERWFPARVVAALAVANARYWTSVAPVVRGELRHWRTRAAEIPDPCTRALALAKLDGERFNAEAGAMLATLAPRAHRRDVVRAIVALQVLFDLLDGLTERPLADPLGEGELLFGAFTQALCSPSRGALPRGGGDDGYMRELSHVAGDALSRLPACRTVIEVASASATRAAQAQIRMHAVPQLGVHQLQSWAHENARGTGLQWRELLAGAASSVLAVHALIVAAADAHTTATDATRIADAYLSICVLLTLLDGLVDQERDERAGEFGYLALYPDRALLTQTLAQMVHRARDQAGQLADDAHHVLMLTGVVAYYASTHEARGTLAAPLVAELRGALAPVLAPTLTFMRAWRLVRRSPAVEA
jgi:tetraprenyl-beta-curcumene synthase